MRRGPEGVGPWYVGLIRKGLKDTAAQAALVLSAGLCIRAVVRIKKESTLKDRNYRMSSLVC